VKVATAMAPHPLTNPEPSPSPTLPQTGLGGQGLIGAFFFGGRPQPPQAVQLPTTATVTHPAPPVSHGVNPTRDVTPNHLDGRKDKANVSKDRLESVPVSLKPVDALSEKEFFETELISKMNSLLRFYLFPFFFSYFVFGQNI
jgi:hypothetical protein